jgi:CheY-like chemotaxis protein
MKTILVVDNNLDVLKMIETALSGFGFVVRGASSGIEALEIFRSEPVHFVLLDVQMPEMNGPQTLAEIKRINPKVTCVFMSSSAESSRVAGAGGFLQKPFSLEELRKMIVAKTTE